MGIVSDDIRDFVENYLGDLSLEFNMGEYVDRDRDWPDGTHRTAVEYWSDNMVNFSWGINDPPIGFGWLNDLLYDAGEELEDALEFMLEQMIKIGIWLLDVFWTDLIVNTLIKWVVWIIAAGLRVVIGAPFYRMGRAALLNFLQSLDDKNVHRFFETMVPEAPLSGANDENARQNFSTMISSLFQNPNFEGASSTNEGNPMSEFLRKISESEFFSQGS